MTKLQAPIPAGQAPEIMTPQEAARYLRLGICRMRRMARAGDLPTLPLNDLYDKPMWRFSKAHLDAWVSSRMERGQPPRAP